MLFFCYYSVMNIFTNLSLCFIIVYLSASSVSAYSVAKNLVSVPYEVTTIEGELNPQREYLGELKGEPHMYEFGIGSTTKLSLALMQTTENQTLPLSLIVIRQNDDRGGVIEIGRLNTQNIKWHVFEDSALGIDLSKSEPFTVDLRPGIYRVEVSTPDNIGKYALVIGDEKNTQGYFNELSNIYTIETFFGGSLFSMIKSSYVYYPLGIIVLIVLFYLTWRKRFQIINFKND